MAERILLDTGVLVALVNRADPDHHRSREAWEPRRATVISVEGVLVEAAHLLRRVRGGPRRALELVEAAAVELHAATPSTLKRALSLMERYRDVPMDLVDALLVAAAEELRIDQIFTLDRRGFTAYRALGNRALAILPAC